MALPASAPLRAPLRWDLYCRVIDNFGDIGVCWRLARQLCTAGHTVRLVVDDASALQWMAPAPWPAASPQVLPWPGPAEPGDVVVEAFGCELPAPTVAALEQQQAQLGAAPVWINLEYLSAESYVERSHGLPSPQPNGVGKWFFYPGFTGATGGLLREPGLLQAQARFDRAAWLAAHAPGWTPAELVLSLFCYQQPELPTLLEHLALAAREGSPMRLLLTPGHAQAQFDAWARQQPAAATRLRPVHLPWLAQDEFDHLLWAADLNFVRGEDSLVRALWAGRPFIWQAYPQHDGAHHAKVQALLQRLALPAATVALWHAWNGMETGAAPAWGALGQHGVTAPALGSQPHPAPASAFERARAALLEQADLATQLSRFVAARRASAQARTGG